MVEENQTASTKLDTNDDGDNWRSKQRLVGISLTTTDDKFNIGVARGQGIGG